ncbi:MAG TPA: TIGR02281 family clan AA aspartic protease [Croceibacterium sp.]|nr:TIGR02281 family clan AA aspartic protease [Croceibacterium sp.]
MKQLVITVIAIGLAVGWLAPSQDARKSAHVTAENGGSRLAAARAGNASGDAVLSRSPDGHFYADVSIDSQDVRMLVDTGASVIALTGSDAEALGLEWSDDELYPIGRGASGDVIGKPVRLDRVRLGDLEAEGVEAIIVPEGLDVSLLGQSFLGRVGKVEIEDGRMVLGGA